MTPAPRPGRLPLSAWYVVVGAPVALSYAFVRGTVYQQTVYHVLAFAVPVALLYGIRRYRPETKVPWYLIVVGMVVSASADVVFDAYGWFGSSTPFPSFADPMYIAGELVLIGGIASLSMRASRGAIHWLLDWGVVGVAGGLVVFVTVIAPVIDTPGTVLERLIAASYPSLDVVLLLALVPLVLVRTRNPALLAILAYGVLTLAGDMVYGKELLRNTYVSGEALDITWLLSFVALGAAGLMPSLARTERAAARGWDDWTRLVVLAAATAIVFVLVALSPPGGGDEYVVPVTVGALVLVLVFVRVALLHAERRANARRLTRETERLDAFERVQRVISDAELELDELLQLVCDETIPLVSGGAIVALVEGGDLIVRASSGTTAAILGTTLSPRSLSRAAVLADAVLICEDVETDDRVDIELSHAAGIRSLAAAPVHYGGTPVGAMVATSAEVARFDQRIARTLQLMASLVSVAISRSSEFAARRALEAIVESSDDAIIGKLFDNTVVSWNAGAEQMYGYSAAEIVGQSMECIIPLDLQGDPEGFQERLERGESIAPYETERLTKDGRRIVVSLSVSPVRDFGGLVVGASVIARDNTDRKHLEEELHESQKLEAVGRLAGGIAHDFNNLLLAIQGYASLVLTRVGDDETSKHYTEQVLAAASQSADLTQQLLAYSRKQVLQPTVVDLNDVVSEVERMLGRLIGEKVELVCELDPDVGSVLVDRSRLAQVVMNLGVNARDAMDGEGTLLIATDTVTVGQDGSAPAGGAPPGRYARLTVRDTGTGMDAETLSRIFDPFFTTKAVGAGTGLGLASVQGTVSQSGGFIHVDSELGRGTSFEIYLPQHVVQEAAESEPEALHDASGQHGRVLLVEDMPAVRDVVGELLANAGYHVTTAENGAEALALAHDTRFDLLLTDIVMPGMNGIELARALRVGQPDLAVILTSGYSDEQLSAAETSPDTIFLQKPYSLSQLRDATRTALAV